MVLWSTLVIAFRGRSSLKARHHSGHGKNTLRGSGARSLSLEPFPAPLKCTTALWSFSGRPTSGRPPRYVGGFDDGVEGFVASFASWKRRCGAGDQVSPGWQGHRLYAPSAKRHPSKCKPVKWHDACARGLRIVGEASSVGWLCRAVRRSVPVALSVASDGIPEPGEVLKSAVSVPDPVSPVVIPSPTVLQHLRDQQRCPASRGCPGLQNDQVLKTTRSASLRRPISRGSVPRTELPAQPVNPSLFPFFRNPFPR